MVPTRSGRLVPSGFVIEFIGERVEHAIDVMPARGPDIRQTAA
jgi:hypothetical protein